MVHTRERTFTAVWEATIENSLKMTLVNIGPADLRESDHQPVMGNCNFCN